MGTRDDSKIRKARRLHWCHECHLAIQPGDRYLDYRVGLMDSVRVHIACAIVEHPGYACDALDTEIGEQMAKEKPVYFFTNHPDVDEPVPPQSEEARR